MRGLRRLVATLDELTTAGTDHIYSWNDSLILLARVRRSGVEHAIKSAEEIKRRIDDDIGESYAISVRGKSFPSSDSRAPQTALGAKITIIEASSWALANCFLIEKKLSHYRKSWYLDHRVFASIRTTQQCVTQSVALYPRLQKRKVHMFDGYLW